MYVDPFGCYVREHVDRLRQGARRERLAAQAPPPPGVWATVRSAIAARLGREPARAADNA
ncbi:MAG TPA: hypothetical protein VII06_11570 [Chloroflexota bacterium]|jgi:hypothetical protein